MFLDYNIKMDFDVNIGYKGVNSNSDLAKLK